MPLLAQSHRVRAASGHDLGLTIAADAEAGGELAAARIADVLHAVRGRRPVLGLATGRSVVAIYASLARVFLAHELDPSRLVTFNLDEYVGLDADHPASFRRFMRDHLFDPAGIPSEGCHFPDTGARDHVAEGIRYEEEIRAAGGIDLQLLGIGGNGHIAFNEPGSSRTSRTRRVRLDPATVRENERHFRGPGAMPDTAFTMGIATILEARRVLLVAWGTAKAAVLARALTGPVTPDCPASFLQEHPGLVEVIVDSAAAEELLGSRR